MERYSAKHLKARAEELLNDPVLIEALAQMNKEATAALIKVDPGDVAQVCAAQERAKAARGFKKYLTRQIMALEGIVDDQEE